VAAGGLGPGATAARRAAAKPPVICISGPSGAGKTRLLLRLIPALTSQGLRVAVVKHTRHVHRLDLPGKDTDLFRRAGAAAAAIAGPGGTAVFGPPTDDIEALARVLPPVDLVLVEGFRAAPLPRIEVHRRSVSRRFLCTRDPLVFAVVGDEPAPCPLPVFGPDEVEPVAELLRLRAGLGACPGLPGRGAVRSLPAERSKRTLRQTRRLPVRRCSDRRPRRVGGGGFAPGRSKMPKTTTRRKGGRSTKSRSDAGRKGGRATLRARGPEFFSEIGRKGGRSRSRKAAAAGRGRAASRPGSAKAASSGSSRRAGRGRGGAR
jgi:molybdopterin-guanine dinucleotide biosynthesis protein B